MRLRVFARTLIPFAGIFVPNWEKNFLSPLPNALISNLSISGTAFVNYLSNANSLKELNNIRTTDHEVNGGQIPAAYRRILEFVSKDEVESVKQDKSTKMTLKVTTKPTPFHSSVTLEINCEQNKTIIVRLVDEEGTIIRMLSWYVMRGSNVTSLTELTLGNGDYFLDIMDTDGTVLFNTKISKQ